MKTIKKVIDEVIEHDGVVYTRYEKHEDGGISIQWRVGGELVEYYRDDSGWVNGDCFDDQYFILSCYLVILCFLKFLGIIIVILIQ